MPLISPGGSGGDGLLSCLDDATGRRQDPTGWFAGPVPNVEVEVRCLDVRGLASHGAQNAPQDMFWWLRVEARCRALLRYLWSFC